ncbi:MAG: FtsQ-type POTRA domain-containing protein [Zetaproteobacteria bacterium]|nr:FtsQ-type POTRA domain-containing protein [Zetaproteobacteria bacterium]
MARANTYKPIPKPIARKKSWQERWRQLRFHAPWRKSYTTLLIAMAFITLLGYASYWGNQKMVLTTWQVDESEASELFEAQIAATMQAFEHQGFWQTRPAQIRATLLNEIPDLAEVTVRRNLPNQINIHITPREPIAIWVDKDMTYLTDNTAFFYQSTRPDLLVNTPILRMKAEELLDATMALSDVKKQYPRLYQRISEFIFEDDFLKINLLHGEQWLLQKKEPLKQIAMLVKLLENHRWKSQLWRVDIRLKQRLFLRPAPLEGAI